MKLAACVMLFGMVCSTTALSESAVRQRFAQFKQQYNRTYSSAQEEERRFRIFRESLEYVAASANPADGINKFSDLTMDEFHARYSMDAAQAAALSAELGKIGTWDGTCYACKRFPNNKRLANATAYDWTNQGAVTSIKDQGGCGSCWAFASCAVIESLWYLQGHDKLVDLSEQQLVSCSTENHGCMYGAPIYAFDYIVHKGGLASAASYPYVSGKDGKSRDCNAADTKPVAAKISGRYLISDHAEHEDDMRRILPQVGPITIGLNDASMKHYKGGIDNPSSCGSGVNHIVTLVGFGEENGVKYWKIKNSWGADWGEKGYYRLKRGTNRCDVALQAYSAIP